MKIKIVLWTVGSSVAFCRALVTKCSMNVDLLSDIFEQDKVVYLDDIRNYGCKYYHNEGNSLLWKKEVHF